MLGLGAYGSDSDASDSETNAPQSSTKPASEAKTAKPTSTKSTFKKVVDRSNPHKIRVDLSSLTQPPANDAPEDGPPAKKPRLGASGGGGFNALLPAPKNRAAKPLTRGVGLKTGAEPSFSREPVAPSSSNQQDVSASITTEKTESGTTVATPEPPAEVKLVGNRMMFKPLSVTNKKKTKRKATGIPVAGQATASTVPQTDVSGNGAVEEAKAKKVSLFSFANEEADAAQDKASEESGDYTPLLYQEGVPEPTQSYEVTEIAQQQTKSIQNGAQSLDQIAEDLGLSESARRQLFGRQKDKGRDASAVSVMNFNTEQEYAANEALRAAGETVQHQPVKAIAPGKHSLKQLVNAVSSQRDALEESFAQNRRNKREAGGKYGW